MLYIFGIIISYLLGSVPFGVIVTRLAGRGDLRKVGSGNIGAANAMRAGGFRLFALVFLLDMVKTMIAVFVGYAIGGISFAAWCGFFSVLGHCYPIWLGFHGGKGVSCVFGMLMAINPLMFVFAGIEWLVVALSLGYSSLASMTMLCVAPILAFTASPTVGFAFLCTSFICIWRHRENIGRLVGGTESKLTWRWKK